MQVVGFDCAGIERLSVPQPNSCLLLGEPICIVTRCAYAQGRVKRLSPSIYMCNVCCVCVGKKHGCLLSYRSKIATK